MFANYQDTNIADLSLTLALSSKCLGEKNRASRTASGKLGRQLSSALEPLSPRYSPPFLKRGVDDSCLLRAENNPGQASFYCGLSIP